ncbi:hypothetical protein OIE67_47305 [Nonomuraea fuscirosea]|uniref:hypothetical protein n=1 Tax=Nonomuraea fuscirosea TaxID=1291556 RepID=UPI002DDBC17A|nr:hypothetical protein [Nonomuraea fuscirosea]WSA51577.1 hypothetical protein OIE67_47305 [Nonomuraea fuscirosea]
MRNTRLLKRLALVAAAGLIGIGIGAAAASSAWAVDPDTKLQWPKPSGEISDSPQ